MQVYLDLIISLYTTYFHFLYKPATQTYFTVYTELHTHFLFLQYNMKLKQL